MLSLFVILSLFAQIEKPKFEKTESFFNEAINNLENESFYEKLTFSSNEKEIKFKDLTEKEKDHYYILKANLLAKQLEDLQDLLIERSKTKESNSDQLLLLVPKLIEFRIKLASIQEELIDRKSKKYPNLKILLEETKKMNKQKKISK